MATVSLNVHKRCTAIRVFVKTVNNRVIIAAIQQHARAVLITRIYWSVEHSVFKGQCVQSDTFCYKTNQYATANVRVEITTLHKIVPVTVKVVGVTTLEVWITTVMTNVLLIS